MQSIDTESRITIRRTQDTQTDFIVDGQELPLHSIRFFTSFEQMAGSYYSRTGLISQPIDEMDDSSEESTDSLDESNPFDLTRVTEIESDDRIRDIPPHQKITLGNEAINSPPPSSSKTKLKSEPSVVKKPKKLMATTIKKKKNYKQAPTKQKVKKINDSLILTQLRKMAQGEKTKRLAEFYTDDDFL